MRLVVIFYLLGLSLVRGQEIQLLDNGYENVLVAISDTVPYHADLIPSVKELLDTASATLFHATGFRAYFRNITILVPTSWNVTGAQAATTESFDKADVRIDNPSDQYGDNPWTRQTGGCGMGGDFMHITPRFIIDKTYALNGWGPPEKVVVHEWGHLRWGLFDEYPIGDEITEHFYQSPTTNKIEPSRCNINVKGRMINRRSAAPCKMDPVTSLPEPDCRYYPDSIQTKASSSFMDYHYLPSVSTFCDDDEYGVDSVHNYEAPSQHNRLCAGQSSWEVMRKHADFAGGKNEAVDATGFNTNVTFKLVQRRESRVVVVMDVSGSMNTNDYYKKLNSAVRRYLLYTVPTGASVGLVKYSSSATKITQTLHRINSAADRELLANLVPLEKSGSTAIGRGLLVARDLLEQNNGQTAGSRIILLTDGQENVNPRVAQVEPEIVNAGINVDTILLTESAAEVLISLAAKTGGLSFYSSGDSLSTSLNDAFTTSERARISDPSKVPVTIESRGIPAVSNNQTCYDMIVDSALGVDTTFTFSWVNANPLVIELTNTDNQSFTAQLEASSTAASYQCLGECATGRWEVCILNSQNTVESVISQLESTARTIANESNEEAVNSEDMLPITVRTIIVNNEPDFNSSGAVPVSLFATVNRGYSPVVGAKVVATIEYPDAKTNANTQLEMRDDGAGADIAKGDGTYSAYMVNSAATGKHTISVQVVSSNETSVKKVKVMSMAGRISEPGEPISTQEITLAPTGEFQRFSLAGFINVKSIAPADKDFQAPSRIVDLEVTEASYEDSRITLEWTAVGDDLDSGTASEYQLWRADNHRTLYKALVNATQVDHTDIIDGNLTSPLPAYSREKLVINIPDRDAITVYAIIAEDAAGNTGALSNIVSAKLVYVPPPTPAPTVGTSVGTTVVNSYGTSATTSLVIGITVGTVVLIIIIVLVAVLVVGVILPKARKSSTESGSQAPQNPVYQYVNKECSA